MYELDQGTNYKVAIIIMTITLYEEPSHPCSPLQVYNSVDSIMDNNKVELHYSNTCMLTMLISVIVVHDQLKCIEYMFMMTNVH